MYWMDFDGVFGKTMDNWIVYKSFIHSKNVETICPVEIGVWTPLKRFLDVLAILDDFFVF